VGTCFVLSGHLKGRTLEGRKGKSLEILLKKEQTALRVFQAKPNGCRKKEDVTAEQPPQCRERGEGGHVGVRGNKSGGRDWGAGDKETMVCHEREGEYLDWTRIRPDHGRGTFEC